MVYKAVVIPTLLYGSEAWTPYKVMIKKLDSFHMRCLRQICRIKWYDRVTNVEVLQKCDIPGIESFLIKNQLRWVGHVVRMPEDRAPKKLLYGELTKAPRKIGRPLLRFKDKLKNNLKALNFDLKSWETLSKTRTEWRASCHSSVSRFKERRLLGLKQSRATRKSRSSSSSLPSRLLTCPECGKTCKTPAGLRSHKRTHPTPNPS